MAAPTDVGRKKLVQCLTDVILLVVLANLLTLVGSHFADGIEGFLLCRRCGNEIASAADLLTIPSKLAERQRNDTISGTKGVMIQLFKNPQGNVFEVITTTSADVDLHEKAYTQDSWFPGYTWTIALCPRCGVHIGWTFDLLSTSGDGHQPKSFVGMILENILHENEADSIIAVPKAYTS